MTPPRHWSASLVTIPTVAMLGLLLTSIARPASATEFAPNASNPAPRESAAVDGGTSAVRYRRGPAKIDAKDELRARFLEARKQADAAKAQEKASELSRHRARDRAAESEALNQTLTDMKIEKLLELVRQTEDESPEMPDLLMRLADLELDKKAYFERQAGALSEQIYNAENSIEESPPVAAPVVAPAKPAAAQSTPSAPDRARRRGGRKHRTPRSRR